MNALEPDNKSELPFTARSLTSGVIIVIHIFYWHRLTFTFYNHMIIFLFSSFSQFFPSYLCHWENVYTFHQQKQRIINLAIQKNLYKHLCAMGFTPSHLSPLFDFEIHNNPRSWIDENTLCALLSEIQAVNGLKMPWRRNQQTHQEG